MKAPSMSKDHRKLVGLQAASLQRAVALNGQIADRAAQLEQDLMGQAEGLRKAMASEESQYRLRRLEAQYLKVMHRLAMVRRAHALAREHGPTEKSAAPGTTVTAPLAKALARLAAGLAPFLKARVKGHWRTTATGTVWVAEHQDARTAMSEQSRTVSHAAPSPTASQPAPESPTLSSADAYREIRRATGAEVVFPGGTGKPHIRGEHGGQTKTVPIPDNILSAVTAQEPGAMGNLRTWFRSAMRGEAPVAALAKALRLRVRIGGGGRRPFELAKSWFGDSERHSEAAKKGHEGKAQDRPAVHLHDLMDLFGPGITARDFLSPDPTTLLEALGSDADDMRVRWEVAATVPDEWVRAAEGLDYDLEDARIAMRKADVRHVCEGHPGADGAAILPHLPSLCEASPHNVRRGKLGRLLVHIDLGEGKGLRLVLQPAEGDEQDHVIPTLFVTDIARL